MSTFTAFILGFVLGVSIIGFTFYLMYSGGNEDVPEEDEFDKEEEEL